MVLPNPKYVVEKYQPLAYQVLYALFALVVLASIYQVATIWRQGPSTTVLVEENFEAPSITIFDPACASGEEQECNPLVLARAVAHQLEPESLTGSGFGKVEKHQRHNSLQADELPEYWIKPESSHQGGIPFLLVNLSNFNVAKGFGFTDSDPYIKIHLRHCWLRNSGSLPRLLLGPALAEMPTDEIREDVLREKGWPLAFPPKRGQVQVSVYKVRYFQAERVMTSDTMNFHFWGKADHSWIEISEGSSSTLTWGTVQRSKMLVSHSDSIQQTPDEAIRTPGTFSYGLPEEIADTCSRPESSTITEIKLSFDAIKTRYRTSGILFQYMALFGMVGGYISLVGGVWGLIFTRAHKYAPEVKFVEEMTLVTEGFADGGGDDTESADSSSGANDMLLK